MKNVRIFLASFVLLAIASAFITPKNHLNPAKSTAKRFTTFSQEIAFLPGQVGGDGLGDFVISDETSSSRLNTLGNWTGYQSVGAQSCTGGGKLCSASVSYTYTGTDPAPTVQQVINAIASNYTPDTDPATSSGHFNTNPFTFTVPGFPLILITVTIVQKS